MKTCLPRIRKHRIYIAVILALTSSTTVFAAAADDEKYFDTLFATVEKVGLVDEIKGKLDPTAGLQEQAGKKLEELQGEALENTEKEVFRLIYEKYGYTSAEQAEAAYKKVGEIFDKITGGLEWTDYAIGKYSQFANGEYGDLTVGLWKEALNKAATSELATEIFAKLGIGSNVVGLAVKALELTADSYLQLMKETQGRKLEELYYTLESDKKIFKGAGSGRQLGQGSPIPVSRENVDYVFARIQSESGFRSKFQIYYEQTLNRTFPTPDFFASMWIAAGTGGGAEAGKAVEGETQVSLKKYRDEIEEGISALLAQLNSEAKMRESALQAKKQVEDFKRLKDRLLDMKVKTRIRVQEANTATAKLPEMESFLVKIQNEITEAIKKKDASTLKARRANIVEYMNGPVKALPTSGSAAQARQAVIAKFKKAWVDLSTGIRKVDEEVEKDIKTSTDIALKSTPAPVNYHFAPVTLDFKLTFDDLRGDIDRATNTTDLGAASTAAFKRVEAAETDFTKAYYKAFYTVMSGSYGSEPSQTGQANVIAANLRRQYCDRNGLNCGEKYAAEMAALNAATTRFQTASNVSLALANSRIDGLRRDIGDHVQRISRKFADEENQLFAEFESLGNLANSILSTTIDTGTVSIRQAGPFFESLKDLRYVGLPQLAPPKWDALPPQRLQEYLYKLRSQVMNEKQAMANELKLRESAEEFAKTIADKKAAADSVRVRAASIRQAVNNRKMGTTFHWHSILQSLEGGLPEYYLALAKSKAVDFKKFRDQAAQADVELAYVDGLLAQVDSISSILQRYRVGQVRHGRGSTVTIVATVPAGYPFINLSDPGTKVLSQREIQQLPQQIRGAIDRIGFSGFDQKANVGLQAFVDAELGKMKGAYAPDHWGTVEYHILSSEDMVTSAKEVAALPVSSTSAGSFISEFGKLLGKDLLDALALSVKYDTDNGVKVDLGNLPKLARTGDETFQGAASTLISAIDAKTAEYRKYLSDEKKKSEDSFKAQSECAQKGGFIQNGKCVVVAMPTAPGSSAMPGGPQTAGSTGQTVGSKLPTGAPQMAAGSVSSQQIVAVMPSGGTASQPAAGPMPASGMSPQQGTPQLSGGKSQSESATTPMPGGGGSLQPASTRLQSAPPVTSPLQATLAAPVISSGAAQVQAPKTIQGPSTEASRPEGSGISPLAASSGRNSSAPGPASPAGAQTSSSANRLGGGTEPAVSKPQEPVPVELKTPATAGASAKLQPPLTQSTATTRPGAPLTQAKPVDKELEAQLNELKQSESRPLVAAAQSPRATPGTTIPSQPSPPVQAVDATPAVREIYQKFAEAYQRKDMRGMTKYFADQWQGPNGLSSSEFEEKLSGAIKGFDSIQFKIESIQVQRAANDTYNVSYSANLTARGAAQKTDEKFSVQDVVRVGTEGPRIVKTTGSLLPRPSPVTTAIVSPAQLATAPAGAAAPVDMTPAVREIYQKFAEAYQRKDIRGLTRYLSEQWQGHNGMSAHDLEEQLAAAFKAFDTMQFKIEGLQIQKSGADTFNVSYTAALSAKTANQKIDEKLSIQDVAKITSDGPRIVKTTGSLLPKPATTPILPAGSQATPATTAGSATDASAAIRDLYQKFAEAYQRKDARGMAKYLMDQWQGPAGLSQSDFEDGLAASFKAFDSIQFKLDGLQVQKAGDDSFNVNYVATLSAKNSKAKVDEKVNVQDVVKITGQGPRILKTTGSIILKPR